MRFRDKKKRKGGEVMIQLFLLTKTNKLTTKICYKKLCTSNKCLLMFMDI